MGSSLKILKTDSLLLIFREKHQTSFHSDNEMIFLMSNLAMKSQIIMDSFDDSSIYSDVSHGDWNKREIGDGRIFFK